MQKKIEIFSRYKKYGKNEYASGLPRRVCRHVFSIDLFCKISEEDSSGRWIRFSGFYKQGDGVIKVNLMKRHPRVDLSKLKVGEIYLPKSVSVALIKDESIEYKSYSLTVDDAPIVGISTWEAGYATPRVLGIIVPKVFGLKILKDNCFLEETRLTFEKSDKFRDLRRICRRMCPKSLPAKESQCLDCYDLVTHAIFSDLSADDEVKCRLEKIFKDELESEDEAEMIIEL